MIFPYVAIAFECEATALQQVIQIALDLDLNRVALENELLGSHEMQFSITIYMCMNLQVYCLIAGLYSHLMLVML